MILPAVTVHCPSNGRSASSTSAHLAPAAQSSVGRVACSCLPCPAVLPPLAMPSVYTHPHLLLFSSDGSLTTQTKQSTHVLPSAWASTAASSLAPRHPLPRPHRRPPPMDACMQRNAAWSTWSRNDFHRKSTVRGEDDSWVHGSRKEVPPYYAQK